jgi:uncharacterized protein YkwD
LVGFILLTAAVALAPLAVFADCTQVGPLAVGSCPPPQSPQPTQSGAPPEQPVVSVKAERDALALLNRDRVARHLRPLSTDPALTAIARGHAARMARDGRIYHNSRQLSSRSTQQKLGHPSILGENVGVGPKVSWIESEFMGSRKHRSNILERRYSKVGIGVVLSRGSSWIVQDFLGRGSLRGVSRAVEPPAPGPAPTAEPLHALADVPGADVSAIRLPVSSASPAATGTGGGGAATAFALLSLTSALWLARSRRNRALTEADWV